MWLPHNILTDILARLNNMYGEDDDQLDTVFPGLCIMDIHVYYTCILLLLIHIDVLPDLCMMDRY